ncbi:MAG: type II secretion system secretin GspD [Betaproteobacteria bacterium]|nr:type II secretion system secretin GspD [Betaproteobacteria bacterium]
MTTTTILASCFCFTPQRGTWRRPAFAALLCALLFAFAALPVRAADEPVTLNFVNADVDAVIRAVAEITGKSFVVDPRVKGTINIISTRPVPRSLVYPTLLSALRLQGLTAIEGEGIVKIVPEADAKLQGGAVTRGAVGAGGDRLVTQVLTLKYESAAQLVNVLRPLITPNNTIAAYPNGNALIITDYADNLKRINRIIASLDQAPAGEPVLIALKHASAVDLVTLLNRLVESPAAAGGAADVQQRVALIADGRSNSILVRSDNPGRVARVRQLIEQLDTPGRAGGNIFIIYLKNAEAARVAQTLRALLTGGGDAGAPAGTGSGLSAAPVPGQPGANLLGAATAPALASASPPSGQGFSHGGATIQADIANNALIIAAPEPVYNNLRAVIEKLDVRRAQVYVEALIVEVAADRAAELGVQWQVLGGINKDSPQGFGGTNFGARGSGNNIIEGSLNLGSLGQGLNLGVVNGSVTIPGLGLITNLALLIRALETDSTANILSTPTLLTLDNEEAKIVVGQNVPFITGQYTTGISSATGVSPFQTIERQDVGLTLRVKPQITEGGSVRLVVYQEVSRVDSTTNPAGIITNKRSLESSVLVEDGQVIVLGGLIQDALTDGTDKVPLAGDVPVVGQLFRYDQRKRVKTNLMIFLKPTVVRGPTGATVYTNERYDYLAGEQERSRPQQRFFWDDPSYPQLYGSTPPAAAAGAQAPVPAPLYMQPPAAGAVPPAAAPGTAAPGPTGPR